MKKVEQYIYEKKYSNLEQQIQVLQSAHLAPEESIILDYCKIKICLQANLQRKPQSPSINCAQKIQDVHRKYKNKIDDDILEVHYLAMHGFLLEMGESEQKNMKSSSAQLQLQSEEDNKVHVDSEEKQREFSVQVSKMSPLVKIVSNQELVKNCEKSLYFSMSLLQLQIKRCIRMKKSLLKNELPILKSFIQKFGRMHSLAIKITQKIYSIVLHLIIHSSLTLFENSSDMISHHIQLCCDQLEGQNTLMSTELVIVYLYNILKILLGYTVIPHKIIHNLQRFYKLFKLKNPGKNYSIHILQIFFIIKILIFKSGEEQQNTIDALLKSQEVPKELQPSDFRISQLNQKFSTFLNINLDEVVVELNQITRNIVRHKVASLATIINVKLGIRRFSKDFLQIMHDSPFNNDIQTIKLCFELFQFREFEKLQHLLQIVLAVPNNKQSNQRQVMIALCSIFNGLYLQNREQALLYCKLNHDRYRKSVENSLMHRRELLKEETFLQHVGFGYYNLAVHEEYLQNRNVFYMKALENLLLSYEINKENYLLNYCIGKIYLTFFDYEKAYKFAIESCKSHRGSWAPFCLLACVYMCQKKIQKAILLVDELLKKYKETAILYYVRAYLQVNKLLLEAQNDEEIQAAKILGQEYYLKHYQKILKSKSFRNVIEYCQYYYQLSLGSQITDPDQNFFSSNNLELQIKQSQKILIKIVKLFIILGQFNSVESILSLMPQKNIETMLCRGLLHERRKEFGEAKKQYKDILNYNSIHPEALIRTAYLEFQETQRMEEHDEENEHNKQTNGNKQIIDKYKDALSHLEIANKFTFDKDLILVKGLLLSKLGKIKEGNQLLLMECEVGWCDELPDLLYYY